MSSGSKSSIRIVDEKSPKEILESISSALERHYYIATKFYEKRPSETVKSLNYDAEDIDDAYDSLTLRINTLKNSLGGASSVLMKYIITVRSYFYAYICYVQDMYIMMVQCSKTESSQNQIEQSIASKFQSLERCIHSRTSLKSVPSKPLLVRMRKGNLVGRLGQKSSYQQDPSESLVVNFKV